MHRRQKNILIIGGMGFIGIHLTCQLLMNENISITVFGRNADEYPLFLKNNDRIHIILDDFCRITNFSELIAGHEYVYHLISTNIPATSNKMISDELLLNIQSTTLMLEACVQQQVKRICFVSSGGAIYGLSGYMAKEDDSPLQPITSYGIQKLTIEKLLYLYYYQYGIDYRIVRMSNPYGPFQRTDGLQGVVSTFVKKALQGDELIVYGDGTVVRDYIYITDAVNALLKVMQDHTAYKLYNIGSGKGMSVNEVILSIQEVIGKNLPVRYEAGRKVDVPVNVLNIKRYEEEFGQIENIDFITGLKKTADFYR